MIKFVHAREFLVTFYGCVHGGKVIHEVHEGNFDYCCSVAKLCLILCDPTDCSMPGIPISQSLFKFMPTESVILSNHLILCRPLLLLPSIFSSIRVFSNESALCIRGQSIGASASVLAMNIQGWFPLGLTSRDSQESSPAPQFFLQN